jgi:hypothetical protein
MVEKVTTSSPNVIDFSRYAQIRGMAGKTLAISARVCRHCGAALLEGESEEECSGALNFDAPDLHEGQRKFYAD